MPGRWSEERKQLQAEIEQWREAFAMQCDKTWTAHQLTMRQSRVLTQCISTLTTMRMILQEPISIQQRHYMLKLIETVLAGDACVREMTTKKETAA